MKGASTRRQVLRAGGVALAGSVLYTSGATAQTSELSVDVVHEDGAHSTEVNALILWQDDSQGDPHEKLVNYPSVELPHRFDELPGNHEYYVNAYLLDQFAGGVGWISLDSDDSQSHTITVANPVSIRPRVIDTSGEPLRGASVEVRSHEDDPNYVWRSSETNSDGYVDTPDGKLWLHPSDSDAGYYLVDVRYDGRRVANERIEALTDDRELRITASRPTATPTRTRTTTPTRTPAATRTATSTETRTATPTDVPTQVTTVSPTMTPGLESPTSFSAFVNQVVISVLSTEGLVAVATALVIVLLILVWERRVDNP